MKRRSVLIVSLLALVPAFATCAHAGKRYTQKDVDTPAQLIDCGGFEGWQSPGGDVLAISVQFDVSADGTVSNIRSGRSPSPERSMALSRAALCSYEPALVAGVPVAVRGVRMGFLVPRVIIREDRRLLP